MSFLPILAGFVSLACGTWRQSAILFGHTARSSVRHALLGIGYALVALSLAFVLAGDDVPRALVEWVGQLTLAALLVLSALWLWQRRSAEKPGK